MAPGSNATGGQSASDAPPRPSLDGRTSLGKYNIVRQLGAGGMGTVYLAVDSQLKRTVALKVLPKERAENETLVRRFQAEAQAAAQLKHENIVTVYDAGNIEGHLYIALEFVEGTDIYDLVARRGPLPLKRSVNIVKQVILALEHLHKRGFVHRDIKPSNILVTREGIVKLTDMGLARAVDESLKSNITREGTTVGTVDYMSPEQARDSQAADIRSDIYSLGCTWYQMLTAEPPFPAGSVTNKLYSHISKPRPDPRSVNRSVPEEVVIILHRMMARKPADRYQTPTELLEDIENLGSGDKRIAELLSSESDNDSPSALTPAFGSPLTLPPRHLPSRSPLPARSPDDAPSDPTPRPQRLPARRREQSDSSGPSPILPRKTPPPQRVPARQPKNQSDSTPTPPRSTAQNSSATTDSSPASGSATRRAKPIAEEPALAPPRSTGQRSSATTDSSPASGIGTRRPNPIAEEPAPARGIVHGARETAARDEQNPVAERIESGARALGSDPVSPTGRVSTEDRVSGQKPIGLVKRARTEKRVRTNERVASEQPVENQETETLDWKPFAIKAAAVAGGALVFGVCIWIGISWQNSATNRTNGNAASPFGPVAHDLPADSDDDEVAAKPHGPASKAEVKQEKTKATPGVPVSLKKVANDANSADPSLVVGRPNERPNFPSWIAEIWNPHASLQPTTAGTELKTITVGRIGNDRANFPSLAAALEELPEQGGVIKLQGPGPFLLPPVRMAKRRRVIITGVGGTGARIDATGVQSTAKDSSQDTSAPLIVLVPGTSGKTTDGGLVASDTSLTFYGVHLAAFADQFPGDNPLRLIEVRSGDLVVQKCSLTLLGNRSGSTIGFSVSAPQFEARSDRAPRILVDRTLVRGKGLTALEADLQKVDLLAINSLFITGKSPVLSLTAGTDRGPAARTSGSGVARTLRIFSCTTVTDDSAVSLRLGAGVNPPITRFQVMNSVFGAVFRPQGVAMIALNDWPSRPLTATNHVAFENLTWQTEAFIARGWQNLVQSDTSPALGMRDAGGWGAYWGEPRSRVDDEPASFTAVSDIAASDPAQFRWDAIDSRPENSGDASPPGCDVGLLTAATTEAIARGDAFARRPKKPVPTANSASESAPVREIDLDNANRKEFENLAHFINHTDWKSGTRFLVHGTNTKVCGPIHVTKRSLSIEFVDAIPPLLTFEVNNGDSREPPAFISVTGGTIEIVHANFRVGAAAKRLPHWFLDVKDGSFSIRDSSFDGPAFERTGYLGLVHSSSSASAIGKSEPRMWGTVVNSFLRTGKTGLSGDLATHNFFIENSILAANGRLLDLRLSSAASSLPTLDLAGCTLAAGTEYLHFAADTPSKPPGDSAGRVRVVAESTVFAPPLRAAGNSADKPALIAGLSPDAIAGAVDWWEYGCAYSNLIDLPHSAKSSGNKGEPLKAWKEVAGPEHIVRSADGPNAVLLPRDLPLAKDLTPNDFHLKAEAEAASWSDMGKPIGATLAAHPVSALPAAPAAKAKPTSSRKTSPAKKALPMTPPSGI
jgi:eukaryotic-like serine/threonine-protein kinase